VAYFHFGALASPQISSPFAPICKQKVESESTQFVWRQFELIDCVLLQKIAIICTFQESAEHQQQIEIFSLLRNIHTSFIFY
jgi:hypothetical protein